MDNKKIQDLFRATLIAHTRRPIFNWRVIREGVVKNQAYELIPAAVELVAKIDKLLSYWPTTATVLEENWGSYQSLGREVEDFYLDLFQNDGFAGDFMIGHGDVGYGCSIPPVDFARALAWSLSIKDSRGFLETLYRFLNASSFEEIESGYLAGYDQSQQWALGFIRTMTRHKPNWIVDYPVVGSGKRIDHFYLTNLEKAPVQPGNSTAGGEAVTFGGIRRIGSISDYFDSPLHYGKYSPAINEEELKLFGNEIGDTSGLYCIIEIKPVQSGKEYRLYAGRKNNGFSATQKTDGFLINRQILAAFYSAAIRTELQVDLFIDITPDSFDPLTEAVFIPDEEHALSGVPFLF